MKPLRKRPLDIWTLKRMQHACQIQTIFPVPAVVCRSLHEPLRRITSRAFRNGPFEVINEPFVARFLLFRSTLELLTRRTCPFQGQRSGPRCSRQTATHAAIIPASKSGTSEAACVQTAACWERLSSRRRVEISICRERINCAKNEIFRQARGGSVRGLRD